MPMRKPSRLDLDAGTSRRAVVCAALVGMSWPTPARPQVAGAALVRAVRQQIGVTLIYDGSYRRIAYPGGDIAADRGVCTDVVVRAYRIFGIDLQKLVHEDMTRAWSRYDKRWGLTQPDRNIDHRRVPNLATFFARHGESLPVSPQAAAYRAGELVTWRLPGGLPHIGIVSGEHDPRGTPKVVHNIGRCTLEEPMLFDFPITGRFRYPRGA
jgi:uncharacterized protein